MAFPFFIQKLTMLRHTKDLSYYTSSLLPLPHGMFTSSGGTSKGNFASLNLSYGVGDAPDKVTANRGLVSRALQLEHLVAVNQIHSDQILVFDTLSPGTVKDTYDAIITRRPNTGLLIQQADCQAILLHDATTQSIGAIHCGWRGSVQNIIAKTIAAMKNHFNVNPNDLRAAISPSLGPCCAEFVNYRKELPKWMWDFQSNQNYFDFWAMSQFQLSAAGLCKDNIETAAVCSRCNNEFFSYRRAVKTGHKITGRNGTVIGLKT